MRFEQQLTGLDRTALTISSLDQADDEKQYWFEQLPESRMMHLLLLRQINYGPDASGRLQGVLEVAEFPLH